MKNIIHISIIYFFLSLLIYENVSHAETLRVCSTGEYKPILYQLSSGKYVEVDADILNGFIKKEKMDLRYIILSYKSLIPALLTKKCDIIATGMIATEDRKKYSIFKRCLSSKKFCNLP